MAQSVPMAASSEQGRNYKSELAYVGQSVTDPVSQTSTLTDCSNVAVPPAINPAIVPS
ncbi:hypothetical protein LMG18091_01553 [Ralstonia wenshanensis]|uniref:Uncharacterized protein n=1 Tax=Ralstonia wenshanensis TaxID=2842456 RepID=A0AAD2AWZ9_9RALS|nr:hypothetical protein LMG18091_01553 [Ralstonia wenshanensis]